MKLKRKNTRDCLKSYFVMLSLEVKKRRGKKLRKKDWKRKKHMAKIK